MTTITIELDDERMARLRQLADEAGVSPEAILTDTTSRWLADPNADFDAAAAYVLNKNRELYRRLA